MLSRIYSGAIIGVDAYLVQVEVDLAKGLPNFFTVGLPEGAVREARVRVESALRNSELAFPQRRITVNLAPADVKKMGTGFDLPIALGLVHSSESFDKERLARSLVVGELGLAGEIRSVPGVMSMAVMAAQQGLKEIVCPVDCAAEAAAVGRVEVYPVHSLREAVEHFTNTSANEPYVLDPNHLAEPNERYDLDFQDVIGQDLVKRALEVAASGGHNLLMVGPPGSGKTMLARRLPSILPPLTFDEAIETSKVYSIMGLNRPACGLVRTRPFRAPHHTVSDAGLVGGGRIPRPGEVSLAHNGVLFLDELPEFRKNVLEVLRQPLEDDVVSIARSSMTVSFPAKLMLVAAMNPCPCGYLSDPIHPCLCPSVAIARYRSRVSGPLLDRIDIQVEVPSVAYRDLMKKRSAPKSSTIRKRVVKARKRQLQRFEKQPDYHSNAQMTSAMVQQYCQLQPAQQSLLERALERLGLSARAFERILKVARTIADLEASVQIQSHHLAEAIQYRSLDRSHLESVSAHRQKNTAISVVPG